MKAAAQTKKRAALAALFLFSAVFSSFSLAQDAAPVAKPEVKAGDRWTYRRMDYFINEATHSYELRVTFAGRGAIYAVAARAGSGREIETAWTDEWNASLDSDGIVLRPHAGLLRFPIRVGATYLISYEAELGQNSAPGYAVFATPGDSRIRHERKFRVVGWEEVAVPAGKFRALKIEGQGSWLRPDGGQTGTVREVIWYVPAVKRWVKWTYEDANVRGPMNKHGDELVAFGVQ